MLPNCIPHPPKPNPLPPNTQVIINARKPDFFVHSMSLYEVVTEDGLMRPSYSLKRGGVYCGGSGGPHACGLGCLLVVAGMVHSPVLPRSLRPFQYDPLGACLGPSYASIASISKSALPSCSFWLALPLQPRWWRRRWA